MPGSALTTTPNCPLGDREHLQEDTRQRSANNRSQNGNRRITPVRSALTRHRQHRMRQARPKVACRVDRVPCRPAKRQTDTPLERPNQIRPQRAGPCSPSATLFEKIASTTNTKSERPDNLADQIQSQSCESPAPGKASQASAVGSSVSRQSVNSESRPASPDERAQAIAPQDTAALSHSCRCAPPS